MAGLTVPARFSAVLITIALVAGVTAIVLSSPATSQHPDGLHGRTWLSIATAEGPDLVLVNGISGLVEAQATLPAGAQVGTTRVVHSSAEHTLLGGSGDAVIIDNGSHETWARADLDGTQGVLVGGEVLTVDDGTTLWPTSLDGSGVGLPLPATPLDDVAPQEDGNGDVWFLGEDAETMVALRYTPSDGSISSFDVAADTTGLLSIDGRMHAVGSGRAHAVDDGAATPNIDGASALPSLVEGSRGLWAAGDGSELVMVDADGEHSVRLDADIVDIVIWYGRVVAITASGAWIVEPGTDPEPIDPIDGEVEVHADGGLLWLTSGTTVVAIWQDHTQVPFELIGVEADLCIGDCDPGSLSRYLEQVEDEPDPPPETPDSTTTTRPPREIEPPPVEPVQTTTTNQPEPATTSSTTTSTTTTTAPPPPAPPPPEPGLPAESVVPTLPPQTTPPDARPRPRDTAPPFVSTTAPPPTPPPPVANSLVLEVEPPADGNPVLVTLGVTGEREACPGTGPNSVDAELSWSGAGSGSRQVRLDWQPGSGTDTETAIIGDFESGELTVALEACGLRASRSITIDLQVATIGEIMFSPSPPQAGGQVTARLEWAMPRGWTVTSTWWSGGPCGQETRNADSTPRREETFPVLGTRFCVSVVLIVGHGDGTEQFDRSAEVEVRLPETTTTTTTTTLPEITLPTRPPRPTDPDDTTTTTDPDDTTTTEGPNPTITLPDEPGPPGPPGPPDPP